MRVLKEDRSDRVKRCPALTVPFCDSVIWRHTLITGIFSTILHTAASSEAKKKSNAPRVSERINNLSTRSASNPSVKTISNLYVCERHVQCLEVRWFKILLRAAIWATSITNFGSCVPTSGTIRLFLKVSIHRYCDIELPEVIACKIAGNRHIIVVNQIR